MFLNLVTADVVLFDGVDADYAAVYADLFRVLACQLDLLLELHHFVARVLAACPRHHRCRSRVSPAFLRCMQTQRQASSFVATDLPWSPISCASVVMRLFEDPEGLLDDDATFFCYLPACETGPTWAWAWSDARARSLVPAIAEKNPHRQLTQDVLGLLVN